MRSSSGPLQVNPFGCVGSMLSPRKLDRASGGPP